MSRREPSVKPEKETFSALLAKIRDEVGEFWIPEIYRTKVRGQRTRSYLLAIKSAQPSPQIFHTLLGIELKAGNSRFAAPDLATARYIRVFARLGCREFAVPYDISKISHIADLLETGWQRSLLLASQASEGRTPRSAGLLKSKMIGSIRKEIEEIGPGEPMPPFDTPTRQRKK